jgi:hypothetical protein
MEAKRDALIRAAIHFKTAYDDYEWAKSVQPHEPTAADVSRMALSDLLDRVREYMEEQKRTL